MSRKHPVEQSVPHQTGQPSLRVTNNLRTVVPQLAPADALAEIEARVSKLDTVECLAILAAAARLSAAVAARNLTLAIEATAAQSRPPTDLLDAKGAARRLGVSLPTLYRLVRRGQLVTLRIGADMLRFSPMDIEDFLNARRTSSTRSAVEQRRPSSGSRF